MFIFVPLPTPPLAQVVCLPGGDLAGDVVLLLCSLCWVFGHGKGAGLGKLWFGVFQCLLRGHCLVEHRLAHQMPEDLREACWYIYQQ